MNNAQNGNRSIYDDEASLFLPEETVSGSICRKGSYRIIEQTRKLHTQWANGLVLTEKRKNDATPQNSRHHIIRYIRGKRDNRRKIDTNASKKRRISTEKTQNSQRNTGRAGRGPSEKRLLLYQTHPEKNYAYNCGARW